MMHPLVSGIVPVRNAERFVGAAVRSLLAQRDVPADAMEIVVVDNGSTDRSCDVVRQHLRPFDVLLHEPAPGAAAARNRGLLHASGEFVAFLDADDLWTPFKLHAQLEVMGGDPALDLVFGHYVTVNAHGDVSHAPPLPGYSLGTMLARRQRFLEVGLLSTTFAVGEFIDWYARAQEAGLRHTMLSPVLLHRRVHGDNTTARTDAAGRADYARIVRLAAARRGHLERTP